jgi:hypothetical protein
MAIHYNSKIVTDGLTFYLDSKNSKSFSSGTASDISSSDIPISFIGTQITNNNEKKSLSFNGIDQIMDIGSGLGFSSTSYWSMNIWFKMNQMPSTTVSSHSKVFGGDIGNHWVVALGPIVAESTASIHMRFDDSAHATNHIISAGEWVNFCATGSPYNDGIADRGKVILYVNGKLDTAEAIIADTNGWTVRNPNRVGYDDRRLIYSNLEIGSISSYSRQLSENEIMHNFNAMRGWYGI